MNQLAPSVYQVTTGEGVTIVATPVGIPAEAVSAATEGQSLPNVDGATPTFQFSVNKPTGGAQIAQILVTFPTLPGENPGARLCRLTVSGSNGGQFNGPTIRESDPMHQIGLNFLVI